jgi:hypothetical protein
MVAENRGLEILNDRRVIVDIGKERHCAVFRSTQTANADDTVKVV